MIHSLMTLAMGAAAGAGADGKPANSGVVMIGWLGIMLLIFYFMLIRPQQRREKERRAMLSEIKSGDRVVFGGGIIGMISNVKDKTYMIKIADGVKVEVSKAAVTQTLQKDEDPDDREKK